jgi:hypothetical protein
VIWCANGGSAYTDLRWKNRKREFLLKIQLERRRLRVTSAKATWTEREESCQVR